MAIATAWEPGGLLLHAGSQVPCELRLPLKGCSVTGGGRVDSRILALLSVTHTSPRLSGGWRMLVPKGTEHGWASSGASELRRVTQPVGLEPGDQ